MVDFWEERNIITKKIEKNGACYYYRHPINGESYDIYARNGLIKIVHLPDRIESKTMTWDGMLYLWLENPDYNE